MSAPPHTQYIPAVVDNLPDNIRVSAVLHELLPESHALDVASGYLEMGVFKILDGKWEHLDRIRILVGQEQSGFTRAELLRGLFPPPVEGRPFSTCNRSIEEVKELTDDLTWLQKVRQAMRDGVIQVKVYTRSRFHAKAYLLHTGGHVPYLMVGSSNFTAPGLNKNCELNLYSAAVDQFHSVRQWFDARWEEAEDVGPEVLALIERHTRAYTPFEVYCRSLDALFAQRAPTEKEWEEKHSRIYPLLSPYQKDGYHSLRHIARQWGGGLLCDGVGLGKTFVGLMLVDFFVNHPEQRKRVALLTPKSARESVWVAHLRRYLGLKNLNGTGPKRVYVLNHTDLGQDNERTDELVEAIRDECVVVLIDEAHNFRTASANRSENLRRVCEGKQVFLLTATPINNRLRDLETLVRYFTPTDDHYRRLLVPSLHRAFLDAEDDLDRRLARQSPSGDGDQDSIEELGVRLRALQQNFPQIDPLLRNLVVQRSRPFVRHIDANAIFPERRFVPSVAYSLSRTYAGLYDRLVDLLGGPATSGRRQLRPDLTFAIYETEKFKGEGQSQRKLEDQRKAVGLLRTMLLKRLESSYVAFLRTLERLLARMASFVAEEAPDAYRRWEHDMGNAWLRMRDRILELPAVPIDLEEDEEEIPEEVRTNLSRYQRELLGLILGDMSHLARAIYDMDANLKPGTDDKFRSLLHLLSGELAGKKVILFTEFKDTARYLEAQLRGEIGRGIPAGLRLAQLDSSAGDYTPIIKRLAPFYNCDGDEERERCRAEEIDLLISTDVLSEGINLQDATVMVNYDLHWNPVRLMQRVGRIDRRLNRATEEAMGRTGYRVEIHNFVPPDELEELLGIMALLTRKFVRIMATLGIEDPPPAILRRILKEITGRDYSHSEVAQLRDDGLLQQAAIKHFNEKYEGTQSVEERLQELLIRLRSEHPQTFADIAQMPNRVLTGKSAPPPAPPNSGGSTGAPPPPPPNSGGSAGMAPPNSGGRAGGYGPGLFACYRFSVDEVAGEFLARWYYLDRTTSQVRVLSDTSDLEEIHHLIACAPDTECKHQRDLPALRADLQRIAQEFRVVEAGAGARQKPILLCWMEITE